MAAGPGATSTPQHQYPQHQYPQHPAHGKESPFMTAPSPRPSGSEPAGVSTPAPAAAGEEHESHGHSMAAWVAVGIILVGSLVMAFAVVFPSVLWFVVGVVIVVLGAASGKVLAMAGYGAKAGTHEAAHASGPGQAELPGRSQHDSGTQ